MVPKPGLGSITIVVDCNRLQLERIIVIVIVIRFFR